MPLLKKKSILKQPEATSIPELTREPSAESIKSPETPSTEAPINPLDKETKLSSNTPDLKVNSAVPHIAVDETNTPIASNNEIDPAKLHANEMSFLNTDPYADDDIIPFDKNKEIIPSRRGSVRSIMSTRSMQSIRRGLGSIKRSLSRRRSERKLRVPKEPKPERTPTMVLGEDGITMVARTHTFMMGPSLQAPRRVETYQVSAMAF